MIKLKPHNQKAVDAIAAEINKGAHSILYSSGVGTGKSYVFMGITEKILKKAQKILYVIPKYAIMENLKTYSDFKQLNMDIEFATYNYFTDIEKGLAKLAYFDLVVIDEAHHLWSDKYGKTITDCMKLLPDTIFLGLTATPERAITIDGHREHVHTKDIFNATVDGITNFEAIEMGLMPPFNYRILLPEKDPEQLKKDYENSINVEVDYTDCEDTLYNITRLYERKKWIAYFPNKAKLHEKEALLRRIFADYELFILYTDLGNLNEVIAGVQAAEKAIVLSVDMLLEGVHLPDITGIILFRNVTSLVTFQQILGRVCSIGNKVEPVIVDASKSGPKLLSMLLRAAAKQDRGVSNVIPSCGVPKPIMTLGIGTDKEWAGIKEFLMCYASIGKQLKLEENVEKARDKYRVLDGKVYPNEEDWKKDKTDYEMLKACSSCFKAPIAKLIKALQEDFTEAV